MKPQNQIKQTLSRPESVLIAQQILEGNTESPRSAIAKLACEHFKFFSALGKPQIAGCRKALRELERIGKFELPQAQAPAPKKQPKRLEAPVEEPLTLPSSAGQIRYLIRSEHGWLGGLGFSASARHLRDRDQWAGWDPQIRMQHLDRVINMSRFLIRSSVRCPKGSRNNNSLFWDADPSRLAVLRKLER